MHSTPVQGHLPLNYLTSVSFSSTTSDQAVFTLINIVQATCYLLSSCTLKHVGLHALYLLMLFEFNLIWNCQQILVKLPNTKIYENRLLRADRQTDLLRDKQTSLS
jgi:hypothetical protein